MISRGLARRLELLEARFIPVGELTILTINFIDKDGNVVDHKDFTVNVPAPHDPGLRRRPWRP